MDPDPYAYVEALTTAAMPRQAPGTSEVLFGFPPPTPAHTHYEALPMGSKERVLAYCADLDQLHQELEIALAELDRLYEEVEHGKPAIIRDHCIYHIDNVFHRTLPYRDKVFKLVAEWLELGVSGGDQDEVLARLMDNEIRDSLQFLRSTLREPIDRRNVLVHELAQAYRLKFFDPEARAIGEHEPRDVELLKELRPFLDKQMGQIGRLLTTKRKFRSDFLKRMEGAVAGSRLSPGVVDRIRGAQYRHRRRLEQAAAAIGAVLENLAVVRRASLVGRYTRGDRELVTPLDVLVVCGESGSVSRAEVEAGINSDSDLHGLLIDHKLRLLIVDERGYVKVKEIATDYLATEQRPFNDRNGGSEEYGRPGRDGLLGSTPGRVSGGRRGSARADRPGSVRRR